MSENVTKDTLLKLAQVVESCAHWWQGLINDGSASQQIVDDIRLAAHVLRLLANQKPAGYIGSHELPVEGAVYDAILYGKPEDSEEFGYPSPDLIPFYSLPVIAETKQ